MGVWAVPFTIAALLLAVGGFAKAVDPAMTVGALDRAGLRVAPTVVRVGGFGEGLLALTALLSGSAVAAGLVGASYLAFAVLVALALHRRIPIGSCGCFGRADTPPTVVHVAIDLVAALAGLAVALDPGGGLLDELRHQPLGGVPFVVGVLVGVYVTYVALVRPPRVLRGRQPARRVVRRASRKSTST